MKPSRDKIGFGSVARALTLAAGLSAMSCEDPAKEIAEHPPLTQQELAEHNSNPTWDFPRLIPGGYWLYLNVSPGRFLRIHNSPVTSSYFDDLYERRQKALREASSESERQRLTDFYNEEIIHKFSSSSDCVRVE